MDDQLMLRLQGHDVDPQHVTIAELTKLLSSFEEAVVKTASSSILETDAPGTLSLVSVSPGSALYGLAVDPPLIMATRKVLKAIRIFDLSSLEYEAAKAVSSMGRFLADRGWRLRFEESATLETEAADLSSALTVPKNDKRTIRGRTTLFVHECVSIGGVDPKVDVRFTPSSGIKHLSVSRELARQLRNNLYRSAVLEGVAEWDLDTMEVEHFTVERVIPHGDATVVDGFKLLAEIDGERWRGVDPESYIREMREED